VHPSTQGIEGPGSVERSLVSVYWSFGCVQQNNNDDIYQTANDYRQTDRQRLLSAQRLTETYRWLYATETTMFCCLGTSDIAYSDITARYGVSLNDEVC